MSTLLVDKSLLLSSNNSDLRAARADHSYLMENHGYLIEKSQLLEQNHGYLENDMVT